MTNEFQYIYIYICVCACIQPLPQAEIFLSYTFIVLIHLRNRVSHSWLALVYIYIWRRKNRCGWEILAKPRDGILIYADRVVASELVPRAAAREYCLRKSFFFFFCFRTWNVRSKRACDFRQSIIVNISIRETRERCESDAYNAVYA